MRATGHLLMRTANVSVGRYPLDALEPSLTGSKLQQQCEYSCQRQAVLPPLLPEAPASLSLVQHVALDMLIVVLPSLHSLFPPILFPVVLLSPPHSLGSCCIEGNGALRSFLFTAN